MKNMPNNNNDPSRLLILLVSIALAGLAFYLLWSPISRALGSVKLPLGTPRPGSTTPQLSPPPAPTYEAPPPPAYTVGAGKPGLRSDYAS